MQDRRLWRGAAIVMALAIVGLSVYLSPLRQHLDPAVLARAAREHRESAWAIPLYFLLYALLNVFFIPTQALSIAAVLLWGWLRGGAIELVAATAGSIVPFLIARSALRAPIAERLAGRRKAVEVLEREGFTVLLILRVVPVIPYTILNYLAGLSPLGLWRYVAATILGMVPSTFVFAYFVDAVISGVMDPRQVLNRGLAAGALLAALLVLTRLASPRVRRRLASRARTSSPTDAAHHG
jgi:uncharacterized membrane protein YdjX (TVP38/TMEM64 family)